MDAKEKQEIEKAKKEAIEAFNRLETHLKEDNEHKIRAVSAFQAAIDHVEMYLKK